jgi:S-(hydroxymethyl)glutathione dehydrogenase/alcohol dehydrogenase
MKARVGMSSDVRITFDEEPTCMDSTNPVSSASAVFSGKRLVGSPVGGAQILRDFPRFLRLAETGQLDLGSLVSRRIGLDQINDGVEGLTRAEGVRTVII